MNHLYPSYHLRPPRGFINDPNGPVVIDDTLHLYFQSRPTTDTSGPVQWGHATSEDLVRWRLHRPAMTPHPAGPDRDGCFSGNVVATSEGVKAFYSGHLEGKPYQSVLTAISRDGGFSFGPGRQVFDDPAPLENVMMFRDPFVWQVVGGWRMVVGSEVKGELAAVRLYDSPDLERWTFRGHLVEHRRGHQYGFDTGAGWECPQVATIDGADFVIVSAWSQVGLSGSVLSLGPSQIDVVDGGSNFYAASVLRASVHGPIMFGWVTEGSDPDLWRSRGWAGAISLPRVLSVGGDGSLLSDPVATLATLRTSASSADVATVSTPAFELQLPHVSGVTRITFGPNEWFDITVDVTAGTLTLDRDHASSDPRAHRGILIVPNAFDAGRRRDAVHLFMDGSIVEVFTSSGKVATTRVYPINPPPWSIDAPVGALAYGLSAGNTQVESAMDLDPDVVPA